MDWDSDESEGNPRPATRQLPLRQARVKTRAPVRVTRSTATHFGSAGSTTGNDFSDTSIANVTRKRKTDDERGHTAASKRPRRNTKKARNNVRRQQNKSPVKQAAKPLPKPKVYKPVPDEPTEEPVVLPGDWRTLPYLIWKKIFEFVGAALFDPEARDQDISDASHWILEAACAAKTFTEPALDALYNCPIKPHALPGSTWSIHTLAKRVSLPNGTNTFNYRPKIETLRIEVDTMLSRKYSGEYLNLKSLIQNLPNLANLELFHLYDLAPYRNLDAHIRWKYPDELFEALQPMPNGNGEIGDKIGHTRLKSWLWSSRLAGESCSVDKLQQIHRTTSFRSLRKVTFVNYQLPSMTTKLDDHEAMLALDLPEIQQLAAAISALSYLEHLVMESSTVVNIHLLKLLPKNLKRLELINCWEVNGEDFADFLITHGNSLEQLTLNHCQSLNLAFLPVLRSACPKLEILEMNMTYFRHHEFYNDADPIYESLLTEAQVPTWPSSLQVIDIEHMGFDTNVKAANMFFQSLEDSAKELPHLRRLILKANLKIPVLQRAKFRDFWEPRMNEIFKVKIETPKSMLLQIKQSRKSKTKPSLKVSTAPTRRSTRIVAQQSLSPVSEDEFAGCSSKEPAKISHLGRGSERLKSLRGHIADDEASDDELMASGTDYGSANGPAFRQLLCHVVDIQLDNQKRTERQYAMDDFLDTPVASDDEWDGR